VSVCQYVRGIYGSSSVMAHPLSSLSVKVLDSADLIALVEPHGWSKRGNINTAALVTIVQCNTLVARCSRQLIGPADWVFVTLGPLRCD